MFSAHYLEAFLKPLAAVARRRRGWSVLSKHGRIAGIRPCLDALPTAGSLALWAHQEF